jgi:hypothetical protein
LKTVEYDNTLYGMENYLMDCPIKTFKKFHNAITGKDTTRSWMEIRNVQHKRLLRKMQSRVKVLS